MRFRTVVRAAAAALAASPAVAFADPATITFVLASSVEIAGVEIAVSTLLTAAAIGRGIYASAQARRQQRRAAAEARAAYIASLTERSATVYSAIPAPQIVYGRGVVPGTVIAVFHSDKTGTREDSTTYTRPDGYIHYVVEWGHHQSQAINEVFIEGIAVGPTDGNGNATSGDFYVQRVDTRQVVVTSGGFVDVADPVITILNAYIPNFTDNSNADQTPTLSIGNTRITSPNGSVIDYTVQANRAAVRLSNHLGGTGQTVDTYLNSVRSAEWDSSHTGQGSTYSVITLDQEDQRFQGGNLPLFQADISGRLIYDPRTGLTVWSDNPALIIRDWLTNVWGYNCVSADIDDTFTIAAANACDTLVTIDDGAGPTTGKKFTANGCFTTDQAKEAVLADLEESMAGHAVYGAQWMIQAGAWTTPVTLPGGGGLTDDDLDGQISIVQADTPMDELFNGMRGTYVPQTVTVGTASGYLLNGAHSASATAIVVNTGTGTILAGNGIRIAGDDNTYVATAGVAAAGTVTIQAPGLAKAASGGVAVTAVTLPKSAPTDIRPPYQNAAFLASDGQALWTDVTLPFTNSGGRARNIARILTEKARSGLVIRYPAKLRAIVLQAGERINVRSTEYGFDQTFRVTDRQFGLTSPVMLTLQEDDSTIYDEADAATADPTPNTRLPNPWTVQAITGLTATADTTTMLTSNLGQLIPRVSVSWTAVTDRYVIENGRIEVLWRSGSQPWVQVNVPGDSTGVYLDGVKHDDRLVIEARAVNGLGKRGPSAFFASTVDAPAIATTVHVTTASAVSITGTMGSPRGTFTSIAAITFTAQVTGEALITANGTASCTTAGAGTTGVDDVFGLSTLIDANGSDLGPLKTYAVQLQIGFSKVSNTGVSRSARLSTVAGTSYTVTLYGQRFASTSTPVVDSLEMRIEEIIL